MDLKKKIIIGIILAVIIALCFAVILISTSNSTDKEQNGILPSPTLIPSDDEINARMAEVDPVTIRSLTEYLHFQKELMNWTLSDKEIENIASELEKLPCVSTKDEKYYVSNYPEFKLKLKELLGLTAQEYDEFIIINEERRKASRLKK